MKKIPGLFVRDFDNDPSRVLNEITPGCEWVMTGKGVATEKIDGTAAMIHDGMLYKRYDCKPLKKARKRHVKGASWKVEHFKTPPKGAIACQEPDLITGHWPHWLPVSADRPEDKFFVEAFSADLPDGTYELVGPKVSGNPYGLTRHELWKHGSLVLVDVPTAYDELKDWFRNVRMLEGVVWHHPDGRMAKIKRRDFGLQWP